MITITTSTIDYLIHNIFKDLNCSIGFSSILFGILSWKTIKFHDFNIFTFGLLIFNVINQTIRDPQASLIGHMTGLISGLLVSLIL